MSDWKREKAIFNWSPLSRFSEKILFYAPNITVFFTQIMKQQKPFLLTFNISLINIMCFQFSIFFN